MKDLRKSQNTSSDSKSSFSFNFKPIKWLMKNWKKVMVIIIVFIILNLIFNPSGVSSFISSWVSDFTNSWKIE